MEYLYPTYGIDLTPEIMAECREIVLRLLHEVGFLVPHDEFLSKISGSAGIRIDSQRVYFDPSFTRHYLDEFIASHRPPKPAPTQPPSPSDNWQVQIAGYSMCVLDIETGEIRSATCQDLRDMIKLANSFGVGGSYPCMPQDLPPIMRAIACFKICWEMSDNIRPYDYQQPEQTRYIYEMHRVMGKPFDLGLTVPTTMTLDPKDVSIFLHFYPDWKKSRDIRFVTHDYGMVGIIKPITAPGCAAMILTDKLAVHMLFNLFDPEIRIPISAAGGHPTDLRHACWAFGSPRRHLWSYLGSRVMPMLGGHDPETYGQTRVLLETSSPAVDEQAALEKMAQGLLGALQGARTFGYAGVLCVDDVFSGVQFVIDVEMVNYIREMVESFNPHPDIINIHGLYEECRDVALGKETFISHINTVKRLRNILPSSDRIVREKLRSWMAHRKLLKDRAREEALERIRTFEPYHLPADKQKELDRIYARAEAQLT